MVVLWLCIGIGMYRADLGWLDARPISYLGVEPRSKLLFSAGLLISSALFVIFAFYLQRVFQLKRKFLTYFLIGQAGQVIAAVAPYGDGSPLKLVHTIAAFTLAFSLPLLIREFAKSRQKDPKYNIYQGLSRLEQLAFVVGIGLFIFTTGIAPLGEAMPAMGFHLWIIVVTYYAH